MRQVQNARIAASDIPLPHSAIWCHTRPVWWASVNTLDSARHSHQQSNALPFPPSKAQPRSLKRRSMRPCAHVGAHLISKAEREGLQQHGDGGRQAHPGQALADAIAGSLRKRHVAPWARGSRPCGLGVRARFTQHAPECNITQTPASSASMRREELCNHADEDHDNRCSRQASDAGHGVAVAAGAASMMSHDVQRLPCTAGVR